jgi:hypothetical protein
VQRYLVVPGDHGKCERVQKLEPYDGVCRWGRSLLILKSLVIRSSDAVVEPLPLYIGTRSFRGHVTCHEYRLGTGRVLGGP